MTDLELVLLIVAVLSVLCVVAMGATLVMVARIATAQATTIDEQHKEQLRLHGATQMIYGAREYQASSLDNVVDLALARAPQEQEVDEPAS